MSEHAVADFLGRFAVDPSTGIDGEPRSGRIVMSKRRLVLAHDDGQLTVSFDDVVDVVVGNVPADLRDLFDDTVTIAFEDSDRTRTVLVEGREDTIPKFVSVLFKCLLNGTEGVVSHPARVGGRVVETTVRPTRMSVGSEQVEFTTPEDSFAIDVSGLVGVERTELLVDGTTRRALALTYDDDGRVVTTDVSTDSARAMQLLRRYVGRDYRRLRSEVTALDLDRTDVRVLVTLFAGGGEVDVSAVVGDESTDATTSMQSLAEHGLVTDDGGAVSLTPRGRVAAFERFDEALG